MAVRTYNPSVRIGNWNEDVQLEEDTLKDFLKRRERGELLIQKSSGLLNATGTPMQLTVSRDGYVHFGDKVLLFCNEKADQKKYTSSQEPRQSCVLALNFAETSAVLNTKEMTGPCAVTGTTKCDPTARTAFVICSCDNTPDGQPLQYGQQFFLRTLPEAGGLYLQSDARTFFAQSKKSRHQEVSLVKEPSYLAHWEILFRDPRLRMEMEVNPVKANTEVIIKHSKTGHNLAVEENYKLRSVFGSEYEISCHKYLDSHKFEMDVNRWMLKMQVPGDEIQPMTQASK